MGSLHAGKVAIITGAASGVGRSAARRFAQEGARVCVADIDATGAEKTVALIREAGGEAFFCATDIASKADNERLVAATVEYFGGVDIAFLNAGYLGPCVDFFADPDGHFDRVIDINLRGSYYGLQAVGRVIRRDGAVVVTASAASLIGHPLNAAYSAAKHGIVGLVRSAAQAFAARGARVNAICPGGINTAMNFPEGVPDYHVDADSLPLPPFQGTGEAQHVAEFAVYLASRRAAFITGAAHLIDGGMLSRFGTGDNWGQ